MHHQFAVLLSDHSIADTATKYVILALAVAVAAVVVWLIPSFFKKSDNKPGGPPA